MVNKLTVYTIITLILQYTIKWYVMIQKKLDHEKRERDGLKKLESYINDMRTKKYASIDDKVTIKLIKGLELLGVHRMIHIGDKEYCSECNKVVGKIDGEGLSIKMMMDGIICDHCSLKRSFNTICMCTDKDCKTMKRKMAELEKSL